MPRLPAALALLALLPACGGTVVFEEDGGDGGSTGDVVGTPSSSSGDGGAPAVGSTVGSSTVGSTVNGASSTGEGPVTVGQAVVAVSTSTGSTVSCDEPLFGDPALDECSRNNCCFEMGVCSDDPARCVDLETGELDPRLPDGAALLQCLQGAGCLGFGSEICDSGLAFGDSDPKTVELAQCLSQNCCAAFETCTEFGQNPEPCIECLTGQSSDPGLCQAALDCSETSCGVDLGGGG